MSGACVVQKGVYIHIVATRVTTTTRHGTAAAMTRFRDVPYCREAAQLFSLHHNDTRRRERDSRHASDKKKKERERGSESRTTRHEIKREKKWQNNSSSTKVAIKAQ